MENRVLEDIKAYAIRRLQVEYGYCGLAESEHAAVLNSSSGGRDFTIKFEEKEEE